MWNSVKIITQPAKSPVTIDELKENLRLDGTEQDTMLANLIKAAANAIEVKLHRTLINTEYQLFFEEFGKEMELYRPPASEIKEIQYFDADGVSQVVPPENYICDFSGVPARVVPAPDESWPAIQNRINAVSVLFVAGYGTEPADVPEPIRQAIIMLASDLYEHPEANLELKLQENKTFDFLLAAYRVPHL
jgi:uncharacterized phiE125 gp8 family phage protein